MKTLFHPLYQFSIGFSNEVLIYPALFCLANQGLGASCLTIPKLLASLNFSPGEIQSTYEFRWD